MSVRSLIVAVLAGIITALFGLQAACAAEVKTLKVFRNHDTYHVIFDAVVDAPARKVYRLLSDYAHLDRLSPAIIAITVQPTPWSAGQRVRSVLRSCFLAFCKDVVAVEDITQSNEQAIVAEIVPGVGDFQGGHSRWRIQAAGSRTQLYYEATRIPRFWVPPLFGSWMIKATMRKQLESSVASLECAINENAAVC